MAVKEYDHAGRDGCVSLSRSRLTGTMVGLYHAEQANLDADAGPWVTVCEDHSNLVNHQTLTIARSWTPDPTGWCDDCRSKIAVS